MPTRFYITDKISEYLDTTLRGNWTSNITGRLQYTIDTNKYGTNPDEINVNAARTANPMKLISFKGTSRRLMPQPIGGTVDISVRMFETSDADCFFRLHIYILDTTGGDNTGTVFATLLNQFIDTTELPTGLINRGLTAPATLTSATIPSDGHDYRLVVELGINSALPISGSFTGTQLHVAPRDPFLTQQADASPGGAEGAPYIDFSSSIALKAFVLPINHELELATVITVPSSQVIAPYRDHPLWYRFTPTHDGVLNIMGCAPTTDNIVTVAYHEINLGTGAPPLRANNSTNKTPFNIAVQAGRTVFIKVTNVATSTATPTLSVQEGPANIVQVGDLFIPTDDFQANLYDPTILGLFPGTFYAPDGTLRLVTGAFPAGELGVTLTNGTWGIVENETNEFFIYGGPPALALLHRLTFPLDSALSLATDFNAFYVIGNPPGDFSQVFVRKINADGSVTSDIWILTGTNIAGNHNGNSVSGVSRDGSILYYSNAINGLGTRRHNLLTHTELTPFTNVPAGGLHKPEDTIVLSDNTIVVVYHHGTTSFGLDLVYHYAPDGTVLHTYHPPESDVQIHHIVHHHTDATDRVWVWIQTNTVNTFRLVKLTDGSTIQQFSNPQFHSGGGPVNPANDCSQERFGAPNSCPLISMRPDTSGGPGPTPTEMRVTQLVVEILTPNPDRGGIYFINPDKTHETYYTDERKIPNPIIKTAFIGE